jgi:hypothetical protein
MKWQNYASGAPWEPVVGYSRAVRVGSHVFVSGSTAIDEHGQVVGKCDAYSQTVQTLRNVERALHRALGRDRPRARRGLSFDSPSHQHGRGIEADRPGDVGRDRSRRDRAGSLKPAATPGEGGRFAFQVGT